MVSAALAALLMPAPLMSAAVIAQRAPTPPTARPAEIAEAGWLAGRWIGEGLGGTVEEVWSPSSGGQMVGHFALWRDGRPVFYELMLLDRTERGLRLRVKHFNPDFTAWEDRAGWHSFEPRQSGPDDLRFTGLTMRRDGDRLAITVAIRAPDGSVTHAPFNLRRAPL